MNATCKIVIKIPFCVGRLVNRSLHPVSHYKPGNLWAINLPQVMVSAAVKAKLRSVMGINNMDKRSPLRPYFVDVSELAQELEGQSLENYFLRISPVSSTALNSRGYNGA